MITGDQITAESGRSYRILELISDNTGQGDVYLVQREGVFYAFKLFHTGDRERLSRQMEALLRRGQACAAYVHPTDVVRTEERLGYIMEYIPPSFLPGSVLYNGIDNNGVREKLPFHTRLAALYALSRAVAVLYNADLAMTDLKFDNLKVCPENGEIRIIDTDTVVSSSDDGLIEGTVGFMPPLTMAKKEHPTRANDAYALGVILFMTLFGSHPLMGRAGETDHGSDGENYLLAEHPVYVFHPTDDSNRPISAETEAKGAKYPKEFMAAMENTFVKGLYHGRFRTDPGEWCKLLLSLYQNSFCCRECGEEYFFGGLLPDTCGVCGAPLQVPCLLVGEKAVPMFYGETISQRDLWPNGGTENDRLKVTSTRYHGKYGILSESAPLRLCLSDGTRADYPKGKVAPLFMGGCYEWKERTFTVMSGREYRFRETANEANEANEKKGQE